MSYSRIVQPVRHTYSATSGSVTPAASCTDLFTIYGAAEKRVTLLSIRITASQTTGGQFAFSLVKRSTADSGGTSAAVDAVPTTSSIPSADANLKKYTANPTVGTAVGTLATDKVYVPASTEAVQSVFEWNFESLYGTAPTLFSASEGIALSLGGVTLTGGSVCVDCTWVEEVVR